MEESILAARALFSALGHACYNYGKEQGNLELAEQWTKDAWEGLRNPNLSEAGLESIREYTLRYNIREIDAGDFLDKVFSNFKHYN